MDPIPVLSTGVLIMPLRISLIFLVMLAACETPIDVDIPGDYMSLLVIDGDFNPDSVWAIKVSKSVPLGGSINAVELFIQDATVTILGESGQSETLTHTGSGVFQSPPGTHPVAGELYRLDVTSPGFESVYSISHAPGLQTAFVDIQVVDTELPDQPRYRLRFSVTDLPDKSYYQVLVDQVVPVCLDDEGYTSWYDEPEGVPAYRSRNFNSPEPSFYGDASTLDEPPNARDQYGGSGRFGAAYFSDRLFEDEMREFEIFIRPHIFETEPVPRFRLVISSLSEEIVLHERSFTLQDEYLFNVDPIFGSAINIYSNIEGGLGIFSGYTNNSYRMDANGNEWTESEIGFGETPPPCD